MSGQTETARVETERVLGRSRFILLFITLMLVLLLGSLTQNVLSSALPTIAGELRGIDQLAWVITAYLLTSTITMPVYGKVSDQLGRKPLLIISVVLFLMGSLVGGLAMDMTTLITARAVQGLGGGGIMILTQAVLADVVPARDRGRYAGLHAGVFAFSSVTGPLLGGWFTEGPGWRWTFWMNIPLGLLCLVAIIILLRLPAVRETARPRIDYGGMALLALATSGLVIIATWGGSVFPWTSPTMIGLIAGTVMCAVALVMIERRAAEPVLPMWLFSQRNFIIPTVAGMLIAVAMFSSISFMPTYFQMAQGATATEAGMLVIPMMVTFVTSSIGSGFLIARTGRYKYVPLVGSMIAAVALTLIGTVSTGTSAITVSAWLGILGIGMGSTIQNVTLIVQNSVPHRIVGTATAAQNYFRLVAGTLGTAIVGALFAYRIDGSLAARLADLKAEALVPDIDALTPSLVRELPSAVRNAVAASYHESLIPIFLWIAPLTIAAAVLLAFVSQTPLATTIRGHEIAAPESGRARRSRTARRHEQAAERRAQRRKATRSPR